MIVATTLVASWLVLRGYTRALAVGMRAAGASGLAMPPSAPSAGGAPLSIVEFEAPTAELPAVRLALRSQRRTAWRVASAYLLATVACGLPVQLTSFLLNDIDLAASRVLGAASPIASAAVPMIAVTLALPFWRATLLWLVVLLVGAMSAAVVPMGIHAVRGDPFDPLIAMNTLYVLQLSAITLVLPFALAFATGVRKLRGVAPLSLALLSILGLVPLIGTKATDMMGGKIIGSISISIVDVALGMYLSFFLMAPLAAYATWRLLLVIAKAYEEKKFSDSQLISNSWWLIIVATFTADMNAAQGSHALLSVCLGMASFLLFLVLSHWLLSRGGASAVAARPPMLLLLRVFGQTSNSERFFDRVVGRWRSIGPVTAIAAPDIVTRTIDPAAFLRFVTGRVGASFVTSPEVLESRLSTLDWRPDPDGRYRVNEFWCRSDSWQPTALRLMLCCDVVVADVRGFTSERHGMHFELEQLAARLPAERIVLVVDDSTDLGLVRAAMEHGRGELRVVRIKSGSMSEARKVLNALLIAAHSQPAPGNRPMAQRAGDAGFQE